MPRYSQTLFFELTQFRFHHVPVHVGGLCCALGKDNMADVRFRLGKIVATPGALEALANAGQDPRRFLSLHQSGSWGDLDQHDRSLNDEAVAHEGNPDLQQRVLSSYRTRLDTKIWIITEHDRSVTTILLPDEY
jgi:hypothetical protein